MTDTTRRATGAVRPAGISEATIVVSQDAVSALASVTGILRREWQTSGGDEAITLAFPPATPAKIRHAAIDLLLPAATIDAPRSLPGSILGGYRPSVRWMPVDVDDLAPRLRQVWLPEPLVTAQRVVTVSDLRAVIDPRPVVAIGFWALFAHPRQRIGSRLSDPRESLAAEVALAAPPVDVIVLERLDEWTVALLTRDVIAADLLALAVRRRRQRDPDATPWEDPLIQFATELELGIHAPSRLSLRWLATFQAEPDDEHRLTGMMAELGASIGVARVAPVTPNQATKGR